MGGLTVVIRAPGPQGTANAHITERLPHCRRVCVQATQMCARSNICATGVECSRLGSITRASSLDAGCSTARKSTPSSDRSSRNAATALRCFEAVTARRRLRRIGYTFHANRWSANSMGSRPVALARYACEPVRSADFLYALLNT